MNLKETQFGNKANKKSDLNLSLWQQTWKNTFSLHYGKIVCCGKYLWNRWVVLMLRM